VLKTKRVITNKYNTIHNSTTHSIILHATSLLNIHTKHNATHNTTPQHDTVEHHTPRTKRHHKKRKEGGKEGRVRRALIKKENWILKRGGGRVVSNT
jgi:hypothetical protein